ncbi:hypothetical protein [Archangium lansingense]|uniref:Uncharacterized protein n=1 Tax=Archangium lansingense TaxID=2995310 RepID=A0ABT4AF52_9BACT|nr:hypothetical protein [Archangium lansinium]MCY1080313.1 hypothetical protein [Archangium lansinium]
MSAGRKRRPASTSARRAAQESLPLAPAAAVDGELSTLPVPTTAPPSPEAPVPLERRQDAPVHEPQGAWLVLWVKCEDCGNGRHVDAAGRHGAMPVRGETRTEHPEWPRCSHGKPHWENCRGAAVAPPCCMYDAPESSSQEATP